MITIGPGEIFDLATGQKLGDLAMDALTWHRHRPGNLATPFDLATWRKSRPGRPGNKPEPGDLAKAPTWEIIIVSVNFFCPANENPRQVGQCARSEESHQNKRPGQACLPDKKNDLADLANKPTWPGPADRARSLTSRQ